jgi:hypothetical protein
LSALACLPSFVAHDLYNAIQASDNAEEYILVAKSSARTIMERNSSGNQQPGHSIPSSSGTVLTPGSLQSGPNLPSAAQIALKRALLKKVPSIREYAGAIKDDAAREYLRDCERFFKETSYLAGTEIEDADKIIYARGALTGKAAKAWTTYEQQLIGSYGTRIGTWQEYKDWILREFSEHLGPEKRWDRFATLQQGQNQPFAEYAMNLQQAAVDTEIPLPEEAVIQFLRKGAKPNLQKKWAEEREHPTTLRDTIDRFIQYERGSMIAGYIQRNAQDNDGDVQMNAMQSSGRPGYTGPRCYNCGKFGHVQRNCRSHSGEKDKSQRRKPQKPKNAAGQTS